ncbi:MAG: GMC family oxidoreductase [Acidobacteriaceae bacterium]
MIVDLERDEALPQFVADVCIVGAGAAGIVLAAELVRQNCNVLLLESGGQTVESEAQALNACEYTGQPHREAHIGRFRALGGTTTAWGGQILELDAKDFAPRPWVPRSGWPVAKEELQPYYERALCAEGLAQVIRKDQEVWREMKVAVPELGDALETYFTRWCPEPNFARLYRETLASPQLCVVMHATATATLMNENGERIAGIRCRTLGGRERTFSAPQYVLCLGAIETVRFLLQPMRDGQTPSWNCSGLLGRYFQSHIDYNAARIPAKDAARLRQSFANTYLRGYKYHPKFRLAFSVQREQQLLNIAGSVTCIAPDERELRRAKALARNIVQGRGLRLWTDLPPAFRQLSNLLRMGYGYRVERRAHWPKNSAFWLRIHCEQEPRSESRITLTEERDVSGLFYARLDWRVSPLEWKTIRCFTEVVRQTFAAHDMANVEMLAGLAQEDGFRDLVFDNSHHHMGGTRMAESPTQGVVDPDLRLHGVENAYVCSASVFPCSGFSNPTHTLIALAIRLADHLIALNKNDLPSRPNPERSEGEVEGPAVSNRAPHPSFAAANEGLDQKRKARAHA